MGTDSQPVPDPRVTVRRAKRAELGAIFGLIQRARGDVLTTEEIVEKAIGYAYLVAERQGKLLGVAGMLVENSVVCVRDLTASSASARGIATTVLITAIETEALHLACEVVIVQLPPSALAVEGLMRSQRYVPRALDQLRNPWREVAREHIEPESSLWIKNLRESRGN